MAPCLRHRLQGASLVASGNVIGVGEDGATAKPVTDGIVVFPGPGGVEIEENTVANGARTTSASRPARSVATRTSRSPTTKATS